MEQMKQRGCGMINHLLQQTLRQLCRQSDWVYAVYWRILPRNYPPPKWDSQSSFSDRVKGNKRNWILLWEDGFCDFVACANSSLSSKSKSSNPSQSSSFNGCYDRDYTSSDDVPYMQPELFYKMSHEVYNFGEGLIGKVAADNSHKWVYKEPLEVDGTEYPSSRAQGGLEPHPRTWEAQFRSGIETITIVAVKEGVIQLGSLKKAMEDLNFVLFLQRKFNYLQSIPGVFAVHPAVTQHLGLLKKPHNFMASTCLPSDTADYLNAQASMSSWTLDHTEEQKFQQNSVILCGIREPSESNLCKCKRHHCGSKQFEGSLPCDQHEMVGTYSHVYLQQDSSSSSIMQNSFHSLLSWLPSLTYHHS